MRKTILLAVTLCVCGVSAAGAQMRPRAAAPANWVSVYGLMYTNMAGFHDPGDNASDWVFDDNAFGFGATAGREFAPGLVLGIDASFARPAYERRRTGRSEVLGSGTATVATAMATGRIGYGGGADLGFYLSGGVGTIAYNLEDLDEWNTDFALQAGTGLEYRMGGARAVFLEWGRIWGYHERDGVGGGAAQHGVLKLGLRFGL